MIPIFKVWCKNRKEWESDPVAITPEGNVLQYKLSQWRPCDPANHIVVFPHETEIIKSLESRGHEL